MRETREFGAGGAGAISKRAFMLLRPGGLISSTILTLIVVPALFSYVDRYRIWSKNLLAKIFLSKRKSMDTHSNGNANS